MIINTDLVYPIGSIYLSVKNVNPSKYFGGTWVAWGSGRVPVGVDSNQTEFATVEKTGGEKTHKLKPEEMPNHFHYTVGAGVTGNTGDVDSNHPIATYATNLASDLPYSFRNSTGNAESGKTSGTGGGQSHNNLQPYITCYMWKRTA